MSPTSTVTNPNTNSTGLTVTVTDANISEWDVYYKVHKMAQIGILVTIILCAICHILYLSFKWCTNTTEEELSRKIDDLRDQSRRRKSQRSPIDVTERQKKREQRRRERRSEGKRSAREILGESIV